MWCRMWYNRNYHLTLASGSSGELFEDSLTLGREVRCEVTTHPAHHELGRRSQEELPAAGSNARVGMDGPDLVEALRGTIPTQRNAHHYDASRGALVGLLAVA